MSEATKTEIFNKETNEMLEEFAVGTGIDRVQALLYYQALCHTMMVQLCIRKKSINFGWAVIHPCPYRVNWKDQVYRSMNWVYQMMRGISKRERWRLWHEGMGAATMSDTAMFGGMRGLVFFSPELQVTQRWWRWTVRMERGVFRKLGKVKYRKYVMSNVLRLYERMVDVWMSWRSQLSLPGVQVLEGRYIGSEQYFAETKRIKKLKPSESGVRFPPVSPSKFVGDFRPEDFEGAVGVSDGKVLEVPILQPKVGDVRNGDAEQKA